MRVRTDDPHGLNEPREKEILRQTGESVGGNVERPSAQGAAGLGEGRAGLTRILGGEGALEAAEAEGMDARQHPRIVEGTKADATLEDLAEVLLYPPQFAPFVLSRRKHSKQRQRLTREFI